MDEIHRSTKEGPAMNEIMTVVNYHPGFEAEIDFASTRGEIQASWPKFRCLKNGVLRLKKDTFAVPGDHLREEPDTLVARYFPDEEEEE